VSGLAGSLLQFTSKVRYYLEQREPDFEEKMAEVLCLSPSENLEKGGGCIEKEAKGAARLPPPPVPSGVRLPRSAWRVDGFFVTTWAPGDGSGNPDVPACFVGIRPSREVKLNEFVDAISASWEHFKEETRDSHFRHETYEIVGTKRRLFCRQMMRTAP
jgi:hypothetical protein